MTHLAAGLHYVQILTTDTVGNRAVFSAPLFTHTPLNIIALANSSCGPNDPSCLPTAAGSVSMNTPFPPRIDPLPNPVSETSITVEGNAYARFPVEIYRNNELMGTVVAGTRGRFALPGVGLVPGVNIIKARQQEHTVDLRTRTRTLTARDSAETAVELVTGILSRPDVKITLPMNGSVTDELLLPLRGTASSSAQAIRMNGMISPSSRFGRDANGEFGGIPVQLLPGSNILWAEATAPDGSRGVDKIVVSSRKDAAVPAVTITSPAEGQIVYDQFVAVSGTAGDSVQKVVVNETGASQGSGPFSASVDLLGDYAYAPDQGDLVTAWAMDNNGAIGHHDVHVRYQYAPAPTIVVTAPLDGQVLTTPTARVSGTVYDGAEVKVNDRTALMDGNSFSIDLDLKEGQNGINIIAKTA